MVQPNPLFLTAVFNSPYSTTLPNTKSKIYRYLSHHTKPLKHNLTTFSICTSCISILLFIYLFLSQDTVDSELDLAQVLFVSFLQKTYVGIAETSVK